MNGFDGDEDLELLIREIDRFASSSFKGLGRKKKRVTKGKSLKKGHTGFKGTPKGDEEKTRASHAPGPSSRADENPGSPAPGPSRENDREDDRSPIRSPIGSPIRDDEDDELEFSTPEYEVSFAGSRNIGLTEKLRVSFDKGTVQERIYSLVFKRPLINNKLVDIMGDIEGAVNAVIRRLRSRFGERDLVRVTILSPLFHIPQKLDLLPLGDLETKHVVGLLDNLLQSDENILLTDGFQIHIGIARNPLGAGKNSRGFHLFFTDKCDVYRNKSTVKITANDNLCFSRALAVSLAKARAVEALKLQLSSYSSLQRRFRNMTRRDRPLFQKNEAVRIQRLAGFAEDKVISFLDIPAFEKALGYRIVIFAPHIQNRVIYSGKGNWDKSLFLVYVRDEKAPNKPGHYHAIVKLQGFHKCNFFCPSCLKPANSASAHFCYGHCSVCRREPCRLNDNESTVCPDCKRLTRSVECMRVHKEKGVCQSIVKCLRCTRLHGRNENHRCGYRLCRVCDKEVCGVHFCSVRAKPSNAIGYKYMFADFEADPSGEEHVPNLLIAHWRCRDCIDVPYRVNSTCSTCGTACPKCRDAVKKFAKGHNEREVCMSGEMCGKRRAQFFGDNAADEFCEFLFSDQHAGFTVIFHNGQAYDFYMLMSYICRRGLAPQIIYRGSKIVSAHIGGRFNIRLVDSLNFLPMPLSAMPKVFGLTGLKKGNFPHWFNKRTNYSYEGPYPDPEYYGVDNMSVKGRESFLQWYSEQAGKTFNFMKELIDYCEDDVTILEESCMAFRKHVLDITKKEEIVDYGDGGEIITRLVGVDPLQYRTMAAVCMAIYRYMFLPEYYSVKLSDGRSATGTLINDVWTNFVEGGGRELDPRDVTVESRSFLSSPIARMPSAGFAGYDNYSAVSIQWLLYEERERNISIRHALSPEGEYRLPTPDGRSGYYRLDGYCLETNTAFEFHGCLFHGCPECYPYDVSLWSADTTKDPYPLHPHTGQTMRECLSLSRTRERYIKERLGCDLVVMRECLFRTMLANNEDLKTFVANNPVKARLDPRNALYGGRTNASTLHASSTSSCRIAYADITSLYPTVLKYDEFPVGIPEIIVRPTSTDITPYFGVIYCRVRPPRGVYHPVLPLHAENGKLVFTLCAYCVSSGSESVCACPDDKRDLESTWTTVELNLALRMGYKVVKVYEVYHFSRKSKDIFSGYVDLFVKHKQEASGWPVDGMSEDEKNKYVDDYFEAEGIRLDKTKISYNPGARKINKQIANSLWGKFGEVRDRLKHVLVNDSASFYEYLTNPFLLLTDFHVLSPETCQIEYRHKSGSLPECAYVNVFLAAFTTSHARVRLYNQLNELGRNALYYDTDSVIYKYDVANPRHPPYGDYLGMWTDELPSGSYITRFVSAGPKSYAYKTSCGQIVVKIKGLTINYSASFLVDFETVEALVLHYADPLQFPLPPSLNGNDFVSVNYPSKITRDRYTFKIYGKDLEKKFRVTYGKRQFLRDGSFETLPFGY